MLNFLRVIFLCSLVCGASSGCATLWRDTTQTVEITTIPPGANVRVDDQEIVTPGKLKLPRTAENIEIKITKVGYLPQYAYVSRHTNNSVWLNVFLIPVGVVFGVAATLLFDAAGAIVGLLIFGTPAVGPMIDYRSGAVYNLEPERIEIVLKPAN